MNNAEYFKDLWFADWDGYLSLYYSSDPAADDDSDEGHVTYIEAGMNLADVIRAAEEFIRDLTEDNNMGN